MEDYRSSTRAEIARMDDELGDIDRRREELLAELRILDSRRDSVAKLRFASAATIAPIGFLPSELLGHIFMCGTQQDPQSFPHLVSQVSRMWREVALHTPALWSYIELYDDYTYERAQIRMERSRATPLDISYNYGTYTDHMTPFDVVEMMDFLIPFSPRWRSLSLRFASAANLQIALLKCYQHTPILEKLYLETPEIDAGFLLEVHPADFLGGTIPAIRSLTFRNVYLGCTPALLSHVTYLHLSDIFKLPGLTWSVLASAPLRHLVLDELGEFGSEDITFPLATLPSLQKLILSHVSEFIALQALFCIDMPSLSHLTIISINGHRAFPWSSSRNVELSRRLPSLRHLAVRFGTFSHITFEHILRIMPALVGLEFEGWVPDDALFYTMTMSSSAYSLEDMICPRLQGLTIIRPQRDPSHAVDLFVRSRSGPKGKLPLPLPGWALVGNKRPATEPPQPPSESDIYDDDESCVVTDAVDTDLASSVGSASWTR
ncbi:hypothetical protein BOTBODRAFT_184596 [Botryobasidium botryosum FD-172 SS1]|uniref:Uncharacterized protein n=1 Tax=Botryobasidium botryosum (strain FD-172 SS1) TaxID=930990 RepID=A0A067N769_BOTB1|nr:hypothetical protein BOTBODRAFT_184596 [Botryobasidium botryosum FD-172 SS1]